MGLADAAGVQGGEYCPTDDLFFERIGKSIPILPGNHFEVPFAPSRPLAISHSHRIVFVAHSSGFCLARIDDVFEASMSEKQEGSILDVCLVNVDSFPAGFRVRMLALSPDNSTLAVASFSCDIHLFSVASLLKQDQVPSFSCSLNSTHAVKDLKWRKESKNDFLVLSAQKELHLGAIDSPLKHVLKHIDAAEWSPNGQHVAVASANKIIFYTSTFKEEFFLSLPANSLATDSDSNSVITVDSLIWMREDSVLVGCFHPTEENYFVLVITNKKGKITNGDSEVSMTIFYDLFLDVVDDLTPNASGPFLQLDYLTSRQLAIAAHRKNIDQHIVFLGWSTDDGSSKVSAIELVQDSWLPRIELQANDEHNSVLGLCIDEVSVYGKIKINAENEESKELVPFCVLICVTLEGKLVMFNVASANQVDIPPLALPDVENVGVLDELPEDSERGVPYNSVKEKSETSSVELDPLKINHVSSFSNDIQAGHKPSFSNIQSGSQSTIQEKMELPETRLPGVTSKLDSLAKHFELKDHLVGSNSFNSLVRRMDVAIDSLPSISTQPLLSLQENFNHPSNVSNASKDYYKALRVSKSEQNFSQQLVKDMIKELDTLLHGIESEGGFGDLCRMLHVDATEKFEKEMSSLFKKCNLSKTMIDAQLRKIQYLLDDTIQVMAKKSYLEDVIKQSSDTRYWEFWDQQKLSSELEMKRKLIMQLVQDITCQTLKLEKHLNNLEFQKFGEHGDFNTVKRFQHGQEPARCVVSLPSLKNTMHSQLSAAEHLSERLSKHLAKLKIQSTVHESNFKIELFKTVGIQHDASSRPPDETSGSFSCQKHKHTNTTKQSPWRSQLREAKFYEYEPRKWNLCDQSIASFSPTQTTVKRIPIQNQTSCFKEPLLHMLATSPYKGTDYTIQKQLSYCDLSQSGPAKNNLLNERGIGFSSGMPASFCPTTSLATSGFINKEAIEVTREICDKSGAQLSMSSQQSLQNLLPDSPVTKSPFTSSNNDMSAKVHQSHVESQTFHLGTAKADANQFKMSAVNKFDKLLLKDLQAKDSSTVSNVPVVESGITPLLPHSSDSVFTLNQYRMQPDRVPKPQCSLSFQDSSPSLPLYSPTSISQSPVLFTTKFADIQEPKVAASSDLPETFLSHTVSFGASEFLPTTCPQPIASGLFKFESCLPSTEPSISTTSVSQLAINDQGYMAAKSSLSAKSATPASIRPVITEANNLMSEPNKDTVESLVPDDDSATSTVIMDTQPEKLGVLPISDFNVVTPEITSEKQLTLNNEVTPANLLPVVMSESGSIAQFPVVALSTEKSDILYDSVGAGDDMEEEAPEIGNASMLSLDNLLGFGTVSSSNSKLATNPFGPSFSIAANQASSALTMQVHSGDLFRPASFNIPSAAPTTLPPPTNVDSFGAGNFGKIPASSAFGQPAKLGAGQQALGSVLGTFGQSRQVGSGLTGSGFASPSVLGTGFSNNSPAKGFSNSASGFAGSSAIGGFAAMASVGRGFGGLATGVGYNAVPSSGSGFGTTVAGGGFSSFNNHQTPSGFNNSVAGGLPTVSGTTMGVEKPFELFTQMRR